MAGRGTDMAAERDPDVLVNKEEIMAVLGIRQKVFRRYVAAGMPVEKDGKSYRAYKPQVMAWFAKRMGAGERAAEESCPQ